jgi:hypothetical protein
MEPSSGAHSRAMTSFTPPLGERLAVRGELLNSVLDPVGHVEVPLSVHRHPRRVPELAGHCGVPAHHLPGSRRRMGGWRCRELLPGGRTALPAFLEGVGDHQYCRQHQHSRTGTQQQRQSSHAPLRSSSGLNPPVVGRVCKVPSGFGWSSRRNTRGCRPTGPLDEPIPERTSWLCTRQLIRGRVHNLAVMPASAGIEATPGPPAFAGVTGVKAIRGHMPRS